MLIHGQTENLLSNTSVTAEGANQPARAARRGEMYVIPLSSGLYGLADEGSYYKAMNPTLGTGIASAITTTFADTTCLMTINNTETDSTNGKKIYVDYIRLINTVAGATTTSAQLAVTLDTSNRYSSGGTALTPACVNSNVLTASVQSIHFGAVTATAATGGKRNIARATLKTQAAPCWVIGDMVLLNFGASDSGTAELSGSTPRNFTIPLSPCIIAPGHTLLIHVWNVANATTAPSWEVEVAAFER